MSEYYDRYHRWEPLAEFHFLIDSDDESEDDLDDEKFFYCLCSRTFIRDAVKTYYVEKEEGSESDVEVLRESQSQEWEDQSHVHFSLDTSYKVKCEKDEGASCYCSASHTDNYCSTDEHDPAQMHGTASHALQPSDSGADLTYQDCHSDYTTNDKLEKMEQDFPIQTLTDFYENYLAEDTWDKFWAVNGERLIWASWIKKYSDYINPAYLGDNNELVLDDNSLPKQHSADQIYNNENIDAHQKQDNNDDSMRERKFSYDSKVNPYKKSHKSQNATDKTGTDNRDDTWLPLARKRSCSEHDRILSPRTVAGTDSMTNVTKITLSSYDVTSSHVTSESSPTEDYSMSSSTSDDQSNDQTRIANIDENLEQALSEELDTEQYWQLLWKKHFGEQYALHYANYIESHIEKENEKQTDLPTINVVTLPKVTEKAEEKTIEIECENSEGNSQEMPTVIEVQAKVDNIRLDDKPTKTRKRNKKNSNRILGSVGMLLQNLLKEEQKKNELNENAEVVDAADSTTEKTESEPVKITEIGNTMSAQQPVSNTNFTSYDYDDGDDEPPEQRTVCLKRSHEIDDEEVSAEKVRATIDMMGFCLDPALMPKGQLIYSKHPTKLKPPRHKKSSLNKRKNKKLYFDEDGNSYPAPDSQDEREMPTDYDCNEVISETEKYEHPNIKPTKDSLCLETTANDSADVVVEKSKTVKANKRVTSKTKRISHELSDIIGPKNIVLEESDKDEMVPAEVALPDSTDIDTEESDETKNETVLAETMQPQITDTKIKESHQIKDKIALANVIVPNFKNAAVEVSEEIAAEKVSRPKLTAGRRKNQMKTNEEVLPVECQIKFVKEYLENPIEVQGEVENDALGIDASSDTQEKIETEQRINDSPIEVKEHLAGQKPKIYNRWGHEIGEEGMPPELLNDHKIFKYWKKRHSLFHRFDQGIQLDRESWFSVTPESVARHIATKFPYDVVLDAFCGAGGNTIQFARTCAKVIAVDIDPVKISMARHNARVYGVEDRIEFIVGDFFELAPRLEADMVFLSPPWGGPKYSEVYEYDLETMLEPRPASELISVARQISPYIAMYVPRNTKIDQLINLGKYRNGSVEIEQSYLGKKFVAITAYYY